MKNKKYAAFSVILVGILMLTLLISGNIINLDAAQADSAQHTVQKGDSLYLVSKQYGITVNTLKQANNLTSDTIYIGQTLVIPKNTGDDIKIVVDKSDNTLTLFSGSTEVKTYRADLGDGGLGDKNVAGDHKTPEGTFYITEKSVLTPADEYLGTRWMRLSYPNIEDADRGVNQGIIEQQTYQQIVEAVNKEETPPQRTALGGGIGIHGGTVAEFGANWTWGCIGLSNKDVEEIYNYAQVGTKVIINK